MTANPSCSTTVEIAESTLSTETALTHSCTSLPPGETVLAGGLRGMQYSTSKRNAWAIVSTNTATLVALVVTTFLTAVPWLTDNAIARLLCGWSGILLATILTAHGGFATRFLVTWCWCSVSVGLAFHWSPAAMAYTLSSGMLLGTLVTLPLVMWDGLRMALGFWIAARITKNIRYHWLAAAASFIFLEYVMLGVFPWKIGYVQLSAPWTIQAVDIFGPSFPTLVLFATIGVLQLILFHIWQASGVGIVVPSAPTVRKKDFTIRGTLTDILSAPAFLFLAVNFYYSAIAYPFWQSECERAPNIRVGLVQVDPSYVESLSKSQSLTASLAGNVDLVCWPESSGGNYDIDLTDLSDSDKVFKHSRNPSRGMRPWPNPTCEMLLAGKNYRGDPDQPDALFVTAMLVDRDEQITARYNKRYLMPFGEYVPAKDYLPGLGELFDMDEEISPGTGFCSFTSSTGARIGTLVCYEDMIPGAAREAVAAKANLLVALINGSAFESPYTLFQHRMLAQLRALENRRYFLRCAATGETCVINPLGQIESRLPMQTSGVLTCNAGLLESRSFYSQFPWLLPGIVGVLSVGWFLRTYRRARSGMRPVRDRICIYFAT